MVTRDKKGLIKTFEQMNMSNFNSFSLINVKKHTEAKKYLSAWKIIEKNCVLMIFFSCHNSISSEK